MIYANYVVLISINDSGVGMKIIGGGGGGGKMKGIMYKPKDTYPK